MDGHKSIRMASIVLYVKDVCIYIVYMCVCVCVLVLVYEHVG